MGMAAPAKQGTIVTRHDEVGMKLKVDVNWEIDFLMARMKQGTGSCQ
jgi:hypothetical protein